MLAVATMPEQKTYLEKMLEDRQLTLDWLARRADMSYTQTRTIVKDGFSDGTRIGNLEKIADALGITVFDIITKHRRQ